MNQPQIQLLITLEQGGKINVQGPLPDKILCYGLLAAARDAIKDFNDQLAKERSGISVVPAGAVPDISKDRRVQFDAPLNGRVRP